MMDLCTGCDALFLRCARVSCTVFADADCLTMRHPPAAAPTPDSCCRALPEEVRER
jgi:hypothetical protein